MHAAANPAESRRFYSLLQPFMGGVQSWIQRLQRQLLARQRTTSSADNDHHWGKSSRRVTTRELWTAISRVIIDIVATRSQRQISIQKSQKSSEIVGFIVRREILFVEVKKIDISSCEALDIVSGRSDRYRSVEGFCDILPCSTWVSRRGDSSAPSAFGTRSSCCHCWSWWTLFKKTFETALAFFSCFTNRLVTLLPIVNECRTSCTCTEVSGVENIGQCGRLSQLRWLLGAL